MLFELAQARFQIAESIIAANYIAAAVEASAGTAREAVELRVCAVNLVADSADGREAAGVVSDRLDVWTDARSAATETPAAVDDARAAAVITRRPNRTADELRAAIN